MKLSTRTRRCVTHMLLDTDALQFRGELQTRADGNEKRTLRSRVRSGDLNRSRHIHSVLHTWHIPVARRRARARKTFDASRV